MKATKQNFLFITNNETLKWEFNGKKYCLLIREDDFPLNPREENDCVGRPVMACWARNYKLGDKVDAPTPLSFWVKLVQEYVPAAEFLAAIESNRLPGIWVAPSDKNSKLLDVYIKKGERNSKDCEVLSVDDFEKAGEGISPDGLVYWLSDDLTFTDCMTLMQPYAEWMPLWLYDHSGISISCGTRNPFCDSWDSGQIGWIIAFRDTFIRDYAGIERDENGEAVMEKRSRENGCDYMVPKTYPLTTDNWRERALEVMRWEVELYDDYLQNEVYDYELYEYDDENGEWSDPCDSCGGFFGSDIMKNGMLEEVGCGLEEAINAGNYTLGEAELRRTVFFDLGVPA